MGGPRSAMFSLANLELWQNAYLRALFGQSPRPEAPVDDVICGRGFVPSLNCRGYRWLAAGVHGTSSKKAYSLYDACQASFCRMPVRFACLCPFVYTVQLELDHGYSSADVKFSVRLSSRPHLTPKFPALCSASAANPFVPLLP